MDALRDVLDRVVGIGRKAGLDDRTIHRVELVCEEILVNIIRYAYPDRRGSVDISAGVSNSMFQVVFTDTGIPFNVELSPDPDLSRNLADRKPGGLGIHLSRQLSDQLTYDHENDRNRTVVRWCISPVPEETP